MSRDRRVHSIVRSCHTRPSFYFIYRPPISIFSHLWRTLELKLPQIREVIKWSRLHTFRLGVRPGGDFVGAVTAVTSNIRPKVSNKRNRTSLNNFHFIENVIEILNSRAPPQSSFVSCKPRLSLRSPTEIANVSSQRNRNHFLAAITVICTYTRSITPQTMYIYVDFCNYVSL